MDNCIFCRFLPTQVPSSCVYKDDLVRLSRHPSVNAGISCDSPMNTPVFSPDSIPIREPRCFAWLNVWRRTAHRHRALRWRESVLADGKSRVRKFFHVHLHVFPLLETVSVCISARDTANSPPKRTWMRLPNKFAPRFDRQ